MGFLTLFLGASMIKWLSLSNTSSSSSSSLVGVASSDGWGEITCAESNRAGVSRVTTDTVRGDPGVESGNSIIEAAGGYSKEGSGSPGTSSSGGDAAGWGVATAKAGAAIGMEGEAGAMGWATGGGMAT